MFLNVLLGPSAFHGWVGRAVVTHRRPVGQAGQSSPPNMSLDNHPGWCTKNNKNMHLLISKCLLYCIKNFITPNNNIDSMPEKVFSLITSGYLPSAEFPFSSSLVCPKKKSSLADAFWMNTTLWEEYEKAALKVTAGQRGKREREPGYHSYATA